TALAATAVSTRPIEGVNPPSSRPAHNSNRSAPPAIAASASATEPTQTSRTIFSLDIEVSFPPWTSEAFSSAALLRTSPDWLHNANRKSPFHLPGSRAEADGTGKSSPPDSGPGGSQSLRNERSHAIVGAAAAAS